MTAPPSTRRLHPFEAPQVTRPPWQGARAFTLLELLVVVAIIALLAALGMAGLQSARKSGAAAQRVSHLKQLAAANLSYAADNGTYAPAQSSENLVRWHGARGEENQRFESAGGYLSTYFGKEDRVQACPLFHDMLEGGEGSFEEGGGGYGYNAVYIGGSPGKMFQPAVPSQVPNPPRTLMFADTAFPQPEGLQEYPFAEPYRAASPTGTGLAGPLNPSVHFRHAGRANVAWCDGSVTAEQPQRLGGKNVYGGDAAKFGIGWLGPEAFNGVWNPLSSEQAVAAGL